MADKLYPLILCKQFSLSSAALLKFHLDIIDVYLLRFCFWPPVSSEPLINIFCFWGLLKEMTFHALENIQ